MAFVFILLDEDKLFIKQRQKDTQIMGQTFIQPNRGKDCETKKHQTKRQRDRQTSRYTEQENWRKNETQIDSVIHIWFSDSDHIFEVDAIIGQINFYMKRRHLKQKL